MALILGARRKIVLLILFQLIGLAGCSGQDTPFNLNDENPTNGGGLTPGGPVPTGPSGSGSGQGCLVTFNSAIVLNAKLAPGASSSADPTGLVTSQPKPIPPILLHFDGTNVTMNGDDFQPASLQLGSQTISVRQKAGTQATGTYNPADGSIRISDVNFEIVSPIDIPLPNFTLTTGSTGDITGNFGNLSAQGESLDTSSKHMTLVGGFQISSFPLAEFVGAAVTVSFDGTVDSIPDPSTCTGGGGGTGITLKEVITNPDNTTSEVDLGANHTLSFDRVFVPQVGVDVPSGNDPHFNQTKVLRVKNQSESAISTTISNPSGFTITPNGSVNIAAGATQDFHIQFGFAPVSDYSETNVPDSKTVSATLSFGGTTVNLGGEAKRAAPEIAIEGTETSAPMSIDLGITPVAVRGEGATTQLDCRIGTTSSLPVLARKISLMNSGVRPLQIQRIAAPIQTPSQTPDPLCPSYATEFLRMGLNVEGGASCATTNVGGKDYLTDQCQIPVGNGKVNFKAVYVPMNASSIRDATGSSLEEDKASLNVDSNDPRYTDSKGANPFQLTLLGGVSPDRSNVLKIKKDGSDVEIPAGGNLRINIPDVTDNSVIQKLILLNHLDEPLNNVQITVADTTHFNVMNAPATIPAMSSDVSAEPGKGEFSVNFTKPQGATSGDFPTTLQVSFTPGSSGVKNTFSVNLTGSVNHQVIQGEADVTIEFFSAYIDTPLLGNSPVDNVDFRKPQFAAFRPGPLRLQFDPIPGSTTKRSVTLLNTPGLEPSNPNVLSNLKALGKSERATLVRAYSTRLSGYPGGVEDANHDGVPDCTDPESINIDYQAGYCSFFYYLFANKPGQPGSYDDETGEFIAPNIDLRLLNPFHATVLDYLSTLSTNTALIASVSTLTVDSKFDGEIPLVPDPTINNSDIPVPDSIFKSIFSTPQYQCPGGDAWKPTDSATPTFDCYIAHSSPHDLKGLSLTPLPNGDYELILTLLTRFGPTGPPDNVPSFMSGGRIWVALQGRLHVCGSEGCGH
jgi:hypothetical protein